MASVLDTSVAIGLRDRHAPTLRLVRGLTEPVSLSAITRIELEGGVTRDSAQSAVRRSRLDAMLAILATLPLEEADVLVYRRIVEALGYSRRKLLDRLIAAQAIARNSALATANPSDFREIPGLVLVEL